jgi:putative FmdB family regulatory protein
MPTYDYECLNCGHVFEMVQSITAKPKRKPEEPCASCGEEAPIRRLIGGGGAVLFKGSGFYETDYRSESYKQAAKAEKDAGKAKSGDPGKSQEGGKSGTGAEKTAGKSAKSDTASKSGDSANASKSSGKGTASAG